MQNQLEQLKSMTKVVADTGDFEAMKLFHPEDATTNPSLLLKAAQSKNYHPLLIEATKQSQNLDQKEKRTARCDFFAVKVGAKILADIPGRISTEVDARLSFDSQATYEQAKKLIDMYGHLGIDPSRILIKIAATWEGIAAAKRLEKESIHCNLTLIFSNIQAQACADAGVFLISPFVGRILDWYQKKNPQTVYEPEKDPGILSVKKIFNLYKENQYATYVMAASFRNIDQIRQLAGCDYLTISPDLLQEMSLSEEKLPRKLSRRKGNNNHQTASSLLTERKFRWLMNENEMAHEKLSEGIRKFSQDQIKLEQKIAALQGA